ncbi:phage gp6-like head-tail connector protein [Lysobacter sp. H21R4]|uniref:phage gp6-like head-tail connector protein n=1 Tax=Lysobacter sp. H21R4 TaxID=2781021 RepID=UPI001887429A|nr:phage gp6-like head-tail connector protein [Lysobacter sp. H21R4]QOY61873.1 phage gp6-like head-tail connector protein [Lysobacter sp. H21R4]
MSWLSLAEYRALLREVPDAGLDIVLQSHLDSAEAEVAGFIGFDPETEFGSALEIPADLRTAAYLIAQCHSDQLPVPEAEYRRGAADRILRRHRREVGIA